MPVYRNINVPAQSPLNNLERGRRVVAPRPQQPAAAQPITTDTTYSRNAIWAYTAVQAGPVRGPQPRLAQGTGRTGDPALPGNAAMLPGYLSRPAYFPTLFTYDPRYNAAFNFKLPRAVPVGNNGRELVGTYEPHDFAPGQRWYAHARSAPNWQVMEYPPNYRNLLQWQQVRKYRVQSFTFAARPLPSDNYFLGYTVNSQVAQQLGGSTLGSMGSI